MTLKFLGELTQTKVAEVERLLAAALGGASCFSVAASGLFALPRHGSPRVLVVGLGDGGGLARLAELVDEQLLPAGFAREQRPFLGHVTVGRIRGLRGWSSFARLLEPLRACSFGSEEVRQVCLYRSVLGKDGASYSLLCEVALSAAC